MNTQFTDQEAFALRTLNRNICAATIDMSYREIKAWCGVGSDKMSAIRSGKKDVNFSAVTLIRIANGVGMPVSELFRGIE